jgi:hypothetical protein
LPRSRRDSIAMHSGLDCNLASTWRVNQASWSDVLAICRICPATLDKLRRLNE